MSDSDSDGDSSFSAPEAIIEDAPSPRRERKDKDRKTKVKKRKRSSDAEGKDAPDDSEDSDEGKLEIDVNAAEPPSKKAKRDALKAVKRARRLAEQGPPPPSAVEEGIKAQRTAGEAREPTAQGPEYRSEHGVWIGNLPWTVTKDEVRAFFIEKGGIDKHEITRCYMPWPKTENAEKVGREGKKPTNRGFAYVDFTTKELVTKAVGLSETLMGGRKVLIKDSKSFEGRPAEHGAAGTAASARVGTKPPSQRVFVGNLGFDVSKEDLEEHFKQAGEVEDVHMATFEDTGKCKGFAWVRFKELESAEHAVRGFIRKRREGEESGDDKSDDDSDGSDAAQIHPDRRKRNKAPPKQKWWINRIQGRQMRTEFAEDAQTRYKKRYHKEDATNGKPNTNGGTSDRRNPDRQAITEESAPNGNREDRKRRKSGDKDQRRAERAQRHIDARSVAPGAALAGAQRNTGAIVQAAGKKVTFD